VITRGAALALSRAGLGTVDPLPTILRTRMALGQSRHFASCIRSSIFRASLSPRRFLATITPR
jgi:hypothetical protein